MNIQSSYLHTHTHTHPYTDTRAHQKRSKVLRPLTSMTPVFCSSFVVSLNFLSFSFAMRLFLASSPSSFKLSSSPIYVHTCILDIYIYMNTYLRIYVYVYEYIYIYIHRYIHMYVYLHKYTYLCIYVIDSLYTSIYICH